MEKLKISENFFGNIRYFVEGNLTEEIERLLKNGGAQSKRFLSDVVTHLVCAPNYTEETLAMNLDLYNVIPVTDQWIVHSAKLGRLALTKAFDPSTPKLFKSLKFSATNISNVDFKRLYAILTFHGALVAKTFDSSTTHLICGSARGSTYNHALRMSVSLISPDWVMDCLKQNKILNCESYHPRLLKTLETNKTLNSLPSLSTAMCQIPATSATSSSVSLSSSTEVDAVEQTLSTILGFDDDDMGGIVSNINSTLGNSRVDDADAAQSIANIKSQLQASLPPTTSSIPALGMNLVEQTNMPQTPQSNQQSSNSVGGNINQLTDTVVNSVSEGYTAPPQQKVQQQQSQPLQPLQSHPQALKQQQEQQQPQLPQQQIVFVRPRNIQQQQQMSQQVIVSGLHQQQIGASLPQASQPHQPIIVQQKIVPNAMAQQQIQIQPQQQQQHQAKALATNLLQQQRNLKSPQHQIQIIQHQQIPQQPHTPQPQPPIHPSLPPQPHTAPSTPTSSGPQSLIDPRAITATPPVSGGGITSQPRTPQTPSGRQTPAPRTPSTTPQPQTQPHPQVLPPAPNQSPQRVAAVSMSPQPQQQPLPQHQQSSHQIQTIHMSPQMLHQHILHQQNILQQQQLQLQQHIQNGQSLTPQQQALQRQIQHQQQQLVQQQQKLQHQLQQQQQQQQQMIQNPLTLSPSLQQQQQHHGFGPGSMMPPQSPRQSPALQMTPPPHSPQPQQQQQQLVQQQHLRHQIQNRQQQRQQQQQGVSSAIGSPQHQPTILQQQQQQPLQPFQQPQRVLLQQQQQQSPKHNSAPRSPQMQQPTTPTQQSKQQILQQMKPIDPTDPVQVAQVLSRSAPSPNHESLIMRQQHLKQQQALQQQQQSLQQQQQQQQNQLVRQSALQQPQTQQQIIGNTNNQQQQIIAQRHVINTSTVQGQQLIQSHMLNIQQQQQQAQPKQITLQQQPQQQQQHLVVQHQQQKHASSSSAQQQQPQQSGIQFGQPQQMSMSGGQVCIIQKALQPQPHEEQQQQKQAQQQHQMMQQQAEGISADYQQTVSPNTQQQQQQPQVISQQIQIAQQQQQQPQQSIGTGGTPQQITVSNKSKIIISQQQFQQLSAQQQQQLLQQNQQHQNVLIVNQTNLTAQQQQKQQHQAQFVQHIIQPPMHQSSQHPQQQQQQLQLQQSPQPQQQQISQSSIHTKHVQQPPPMYTQKQPSLDSADGPGGAMQQPQQQQQIQHSQQSPQMITQTQVILNPQQQRVQQQQQGNISQQPQQIVINQQVISNSHRLQYIQQQQQLQLQQRNPIQNTIIVGQQQLQQAPHQQIIIQQQTLSSSTTQQQQQQVQQQQLMAIQSANNIPNQVILQQQKPVLQQQLSVDGQQIQQSQQQQIVLQQQPMQQTVVIQQQQLPQQQLSAMAHSPNQQHQPQLIMQQSSPQQLQQPQQQQHWSPQQQQQQSSAAIQSQSAQVSTPQVNSGTHMVTTNPSMGTPQHFIRAIRPGQWQQTGLSTGTTTLSGQPQRQVIQVDDKTHAHLMTLDPVKKMEYIAKLQLQNQKRLMIRQQGPYQPRPGAPNVVATTVQRPSGAPTPCTPHIIVQSQMPAGLTQQQQIQWLQQQGARQVVVRTGAAPGLSPITQQQAIVTGVQQTQQMQGPTATATQFNPNDPNQQLLQRQLRVQQVQLQQGSPQKPPTQQQPGVQLAGMIAEQQTVAPVAPLASDSSVMTTMGPRNMPMNSVETQQQQLQQITNPQQQVLQQTQQQQMNLKTKTALANMLNSRLGNNGGAIQIPPQQTMAVTATTGTGVSDQTSQQQQQQQQHPQQIIQHQVVVAGNAASGVILQQQQQQQAPQPQTGAGNVVIEQQETAAGRLRLMTQQHNASIQQPGAAQHTSPGTQLIQGVVSATPTRIPQELVVLQQQQQLQLRRSGGVLQAQLSSGGHVVSAVAGQQQIVVAGHQQHQQQLGIATGVQQQISVAQVTQSHGSQPNQGIMTPAGFIQGRPNMPLPPRPQFYGHNPNLKLPPDLFLVGCTFYIVEYDETDANELPIWMETIRQFGGDIERGYCQRVTHVLCRTQRHGVVMQALRDSKRCITAYWLSDICFKKQLLPPWQALHLPFPSQFGYQKPLDRHIISTDGFDGEESFRIKQMVEECGAIYTSYMSRHNTVLICKRPEGDKYTAAKEWNIPTCNAIWLADICIGNLSGMSQYENQKYQQYSLTAPFRIDYPLVPHLMAAWKAPINLTQEAHERVKRSLADPYFDQKAKRQKISPYQEEIPETIVCVEYPHNDKPPKVIFSQVADPESLKKAVITLGGIVVDNPEDATFLIMTRESRTCKLIQAVCHVDYVLKSSWLVESAKAGRFLPPDPYKIYYIPVDENLKFHLDTVLRSSIRNTLFTGKYFFVTPDVFPARSEIVRMIESSGGKVELKRRSAQSVAETHTQSPESYIIVTCPNDMHLCVDLARHGNPKCPIVSTEFVMSSILKQKLEIEPNLITYLYNNNYPSTKSK